MSRLKILEAYLQVASLGSVTAAAKHLGVSQPSVSRMIQELERDLGQPLFERVGQRLVLTPKGMVLRDDVERALAGFVNLWERAREVVGEAEPPIRISAVSALAFGLLTDAWKALGSQDGTLYGITYTFGDRSAMFYKTASMAKAGITAFAMEFMPRITRAQVMDVLSSQANLAGYQAVIDAAYEYDRALPMMMTAAGTVPAAKTFIMGVGVAGLQAIATARRLGAVVTATDVRPAVKEQVQSLGAKFLAVEDEEFKAAETAGGYAKEMSKDYQAKQAALTADHIAKQDIVITTALIPGRPAPKLVSAAMVASMKPGSVIVDLAVERGGNVEGAVAGKVVTTANGVKIVGHLNVAGRIAASASLLYAKNLYAFLETMVDKETKQLAIKRDDELVKATMLTDAGKVVHPAFAKAAEPYEEPAAIPAKTLVADAAAKPAAKKPAARRTAAVKKPSTGKGTA